MKHQVNHYRRFTTPAKKFGYIRWDEHEKIVTIVFLLSCVLLLTSCVDSKYSRVVGDYDTSKLKGSFVDSENEAYQIGKNSLDRPVFKSTQKAWDAFIVDYAVGIATIQEAFNLDPISQDDYKFYSTYGLDMPEGYSAEVEEQCKDVSYFLQIYANSFR